jgi:ABC-type multidrug transport system ATPase subunit
MELRIENLSKTYSNGVKALKDVSLTIDAGMFGLLGPNGAGKSTLMRTLATLQEPDSGEATLGDIDVIKNKKEVRQILGYLPQEFGVYPKVSAEDMLDHLAGLKGIARAVERKALVADLLRQTNLYQFRGKPLGGFSGGMKQRFGIAQALIGRPRLIIVDEPTAGLDPEERVRFHNLLSQIGENVIVILSTHIVADVSDLCQKMAIINEGAVLLMGEPSRAVAALAGKIWKKTVDKSEVEEHQRRLKVISTRLFSGRTLLRIYNPDRPDPQCDPTEPDLEDVYFWTLKRRAWENGGAAIPTQANA